MEDVITALVAALTPAAFYDVIVTLVPFITVVVLVALGIYFLRRLVKGASKAKVKF